MKNRILLSILTGCLVLTTSNVSAVPFNKTGTIIRTLASEQIFGGCMIMLDVKVGDGTQCPNNGWVSLDCDSNHLTGKTGERLYSSAMVAASLKQVVSLTIDHSKKNSSYCVATRLDILF